MTVTGELATRQLSYAPVGSTRPGDKAWTPPPGFRPYERAVVIGAGEERWQRATTLLLECGVKTRSGFRIEPDGDTGMRGRAGRGLLAGGLVRAVRRP